MHNFLKLFEDPVFSRYRFLFVSILLLFVLFFCCYQRQSVKGGVSHLLALDRSLATAMLTNKQKRSLSFPFHVVFFDRRGIVQ